MKKIQKDLGSIALFFLSVLLTNCGGSKTDNSKLTLTDNPPFSIKEVYSQKWMAGVKEGGSGEVLMVTFSEIQKEVTIKKAYFKKMETEFVKDLNKNFSYAAGFKNVIKKDIIMDGNSENEADNIPPQKLPFQLNDTEAVINYSFKGKEYFFKISDIEEKEVIAYPGSPPNNEN